MLRLTLLALGCTAAVAGCTRSQVELTGTAQEIPWSAARPLSWTDFRGAVDPRSPSDRVAITAASLRWGYKYRVERDSSYCAYRITDIHSEATFSQRDSWAKPDYRIAAVLTHEQGHFDLTQIYKRVLDERAADLIGVRNTCAGSTLEEASRSTERAAAALVQALFDGIWQQLSVTQAAYDYQTQHGIATEPQKRWTESIQRGLRTGNWEQPT